MAKPPRPRKELRQGFSTGTAATAASQGALWELLRQPCPDEVEVPLPGGGSLTITLQSHRLLDDRGEAVVVKDAGDDPDVTNGAQIGARVRFLPPPGYREEIVSRESEGAARRKPQTENRKPAVEVVFKGGEGVGRVTKPGLSLAVGEPAINPVPRKMIRRSLIRVWDQVYPGRPLSLEVEIYIPGGEELARHTLNPRLGIVGGLSILGTTGLVKPFSHQAYRATIAASLRVAQALSLPRIVFSTGGKSEGYLQTQLPNLPPEAFIQMGDYVRFALRVAAGLGFKEITVGAFFGKALKIAQGKGHTHASRGLPNLPELGHWTRDTVGSSSLAQEVAQANTARQALEIIRGAAADRVVAEVGRRMLAALCTYIGSEMSLTAVILDFNGATLWRGESQSPCGKGIGKGEDRCGI